MADFTEKVVSIKVIDSSCSSSLLKIPRSSRFIKILIPGICV